MQNVEEFYAKSHKGNRYNPPEHFGQDFNGYPQGEPIPARRSGKVSGAGYDAGYGNWVEIDADSGGYDFYAHMDSHTRHDIGSRVTENESCIAGVDETGSLARGVHLHTGQSVHKGGALAREVVDPNPKITAIVRRRTKAKFIALWKNGVGEAPTSQNTGDYVNKLIAAEITWEGIRDVLRQTKRYKARKKAGQVPW